MSPETGFGISSTLAMGANVPGIPAFSSGEQFRIVTATNDVLKLAYDGGALTTVTLCAGVYTYTTLAAEIETQVDAAFTITSTVSFEDADEYHESKFTIAVTTGHTIDYTNTASTAGATIGFTADTTAAVSITSDSYVHGLNTITFTFDDNDNGTDCEYALYSNTDSKYIGTDGVADEASAVWQTYANWSNGGASGTVTVVGLTDYTDYTFKAKARNADDVETAFSSNSSNMSTYVALDFSDQSDEREREITTGNTKIINTTANCPTVDTTQTYGDIKVTMSLQNHASTASRLTMEYSEDSGVNYSAAHHFFTIDSGNDVLNFTSDQGTADIDVADGDYATGAAMATALQTAMNANNTLTGTGTITFAVSFSGTTKKYTIDAGTGHTIAYDHYSTNNDGGFTFGFNDSKDAAQTITSQMARGDSPHQLTTDDDGISHDIYWDSYRDAGESEQKTSLAMLRFTPYDASPSGGDAGIAVATAAFTVDNRPVSVTVLNYNVADSTYDSDNLYFDKDTTPIFAAIMQNVKGGKKLFWRIRVYNNADVLQFSKISAMDITGWEYETAPNTWATVPATGVDPNYVDGVNRIRYTVQAANLLTADNDDPYKIIMNQAELRNRT